MTSEIALWNRMSVAMAADSASSWGTTVYNTSEKIYQLAGRQPVGYMTCGLGAYMNVTWDRIFGAYRDFLGSHGRNNSREAMELPKIESHPLPDSIDYREEDWGGWNKDSGYWDSPPPPPRENLADDDKGPRKAPPEWDDMGYVEHFLHFLSSSEYAVNNLSSGEVQYQYRSEDITELLKNEQKLPSLFTRYLAERTGRSAFPKDASSKEKDIAKEMMKVHQQLTKMLCTEIVEWAKTEFETLSKDQRSEHRRLLRKETEFLNRCVEDFCINHKIKLTTRLRTILRKLACIFLVRGDRDPNSSSSVVIAGFGEEEEVPSVVHLEIYAKWDNKLCVRRIGGDFLIDGKDRRYRAWGGFIEPFAQTNMIDALLSGRHLEWDKSMEKALAKSIGPFLEEIAVKTKGIKLDGKLFERLKSKALNKKRIGKLNRRLIQKSKHRFERGMENPGIGTTSYAGSAIYRLSPDDLAMLAGQLIDIEVVFQYSIGGEGRGVGGVTDIVSITKEDGLMLVKRKDTFDPDLNPRTHHGQRHRARHI